MSDLSPYLQERIKAFNALESLAAEIDEMGDFLVNVLRENNKILTCGNGGSAAEAQHFSTELVGRFRSNRRSLPALSLNADGSALTCIANDFGSEFVFSRQLEGLAQPGDALVVFSSSGNSKNIVQVLKTARDLPQTSLALLGKGGGSCQGLADRELIVPASSTAVVQEIHLLLIHYFCEAIEKAFPAA